MKLVYVIGPYRAESISGIVENIRSAEGLSKVLWHMGYAVLCPHMNSSLMDGLVPDERFLAGAKIMLSLCDLAVVLPGYRKSAGSKAEIRWAQSEEIPVFFWPANKPELLSLARMEEKENPV